MKKPMYEYPPIYNGNEGYLKSLDNFFEQWNEYSKEQRLLGKVPPPPAGKEPYRSVGGPMVF